MNKHTPAPWYISAPKFTGKWAGFNTYQGKVIGIYAANDDLEAIALVPKDEFLIHKEQDHLANAKLIAAAPTMYSEIRKAQAVLAAYILPDSRVTTEECMNQLLGILDDRDFCKLLKEISS